MILTRHLLIRRAFRDNCFFTEYDYNESVFVFNLIISLSTNLKLSIDIFVISVRHVFTEFRFIFLFKTKRQNAHHACFLYFIKAQCFVDIVCTQIKVDHLLVYYVAYI